MAAKKKVISHSAEPDSVCKDVLVFSELKSFVVLFTYIVNSV